MIEELRPYAEYKASGLPWTGAVPAHWKVHQAGQIGRLLKGSGGSKADNVDEGMPCVRYGQLYTKYRGFIHAPKSFIRPSKAAQYTAIRYGDVLFAASGEKVDEIGKSAVNLMRTAAFCGGDVIILRPRMDACPPFLGYALDSYASAGQKATMCRGSTIKHIYPDELRLLAVSLPPPDEQAAIVRFLDHANWKIDGFIRAKRKLIGLLNEQKQAIIHRAVTRGLHPDVPLKPSGIPWLGDIPQHWGIVRNMALFAHRVEPGIAGLPVLQVSLRSGITAEELDQFGRPKRLIADATKYKRIHQGDMAYNTMRMWQGAVGVSPSDGLVSPAYVALKPRKYTCPEFYDFIFHTEVYKQQVNRQSTGIVSDRNRLYWDSFKQMPNLTLPPTEQNEIVSFIAKETAPLNTAIARTEREIALMQEYRTRLTADLVTGKLDVRAAAAQLPAPPAAAAESAPDEPLDEIETEETE
jgi:type I restriction enzyme S subunit